MKARVNKNTLIFRIVALGMALIGVLWTMSYLSSGGFVGGQNSLLHVLFEAQPPVDKVPQNQ
ncbi:MAG: hypothetical protein ACK5P6_09190 [Pseudobdellovibrionaceae bacterium]|jgi:hypothetical protein